MAGAERLLSNLDEVEENNCEREDDLKSENDNDLSFNDPKISNEKENVCIRN